MLGPGFKPGERYLVSLVGSTPTGFRQSNINNQSHLICTLLPSGNITGNVNARNNLRIGEDSAAASQDRAADATHRETSHDYQRARSGSPSLSHFSRISRLRNPSRIGYKIGYETLQNRSKQAKMLQTLRAAYPLQNKTP